MLKSRILQMNADLIVVVKYSVGTLSTPVGKRVWLVQQS